MEQEELSALKRERVNRSLSFSPAIGLDTTNEDVDMLGNDSDGVLRVSCKQVRRDSLSVKSLVNTAPSLRITIME